MPPLTTNHFSDSSGLITEALFTGVKHSSFSPISLHTVQHYKNTKDNNNHFLRPLHSSSCLIRTGSAPLTLRTPAGRGTFTWSCSAIHVLSSYLFCFIFTHDEVFGDRCHSQRYFYRDAISRRAVRVTSTGWTALFTPDCIHVKGLCAHPANYKVANRKSVLRLINASCTPVRLHRRIWVCIADHEYKIKNSLTAPCRHESDNKCQEMPVLL